MNVPGSVLGDSHVLKTFVLALKFSGKLNSGEELTYNGIHTMIDAD